MKNWQKVGFVFTALLSMGATAAEFNFERPGSGFNTGVTPVGQLAWEQSLPTIAYDRSHIANENTKTLGLQSNVLLRTGLSTTHGLELQLGWDGPMWEQTKKQGQKTEKNGLGDVSVGLKKAIDLHDDRMSMALLAQVVFATGNTDFSANHEIYRLASSVQYKQNDIVTTGITMRYELNDHDLAITAIPNVRYKLADRWTGYSEYVYRKQESQNYESSLSTGLVYAVNDKLQLDGSIGFGLSDATTDYKGALGVSYLF